MKALTRLFVAVLLLVVGALIGASLNLEAVVEQGSLRPLVNGALWMVVGVVLCGVLAIAFRRSVAEKPERAELFKALGAAFVAVLAGFGSLLASSLVEKQNALLDDQNRLVNTQNTYFEYRGVEEVFMGLRTRYLAVRSRLPDRAWRNGSRFSRTEPERCVEHKTALDAYWQQAFLEWYVLKELPGVLAVEGVSSDRLAGERRAALWDDFYKPALTRSLLQTRMVQALKSMLKEAPGVFGGEIGDFERAMAGLYDQADEDEHSSSKEHWKEFEQIEPIVEFGSAWRQCEKPYSAPTTPRGP